MKDFSEYDDCEKFLEREMGIKGNYDKSNQSVYDTATSTMWGCGIFVFLGFILMLCGAIF